MRLLWEAGEENGILGPGVLILNPEPDGGQGVRIVFPLPVRQIITKLRENGYEAYAVGGCVRDALLGREPEDWDITTSAKPQEVKRLFRRTIDTGIQHGTVTIMIGSDGYEVTTYRIDGAYEDGRHPKQVAFTSSLLEDLKRRDFTINAMACGDETEVVDAFGGMEDLRRGVIRCVGDPLERFGEDALRILRAIRFSAQLDFSIEENTWNAIPVIAPNLAKVSRERVQIELTKLLLSGHPEKIACVYETGIAAYVSKEFAALPWREAVIPASLPAEKYVRWAAFLRCTRYNMAAGVAAGREDAETVDSQAAVMNDRDTSSYGDVLSQDAAETAVRILRELKFDNDTIARVRTLVSWSGRKIPAQASAVRRAMSRMRLEVWDALMELEKYPEEIHALSAQIRADGDCLDLKHLALTGQDLIAAGVKPGREMGQLLGQLLDHVLERPQDNQKEILMDVLKKLASGND